MRVSQSKIKTWRMCQQAYHYKYWEFLRRKRIKRPFQFGTIIHSMLEAHANADDPFEELDKIKLEKGKLFAAEREAYGEIVDDIRTIMTEYFDFWPEDHLISLRKNKRNAEHPFEIEVERGLIVTGKIDEVDVTPNKLKWLTDHKSFKRLPSEDHRWRNLQSSVYIRVIEMMGWWDNIAGTCWNYVKSKPPTVPQLLKSGELSQKNIDTLPSVVRKALKENKMKARDYPKLMELAEDNRKNYFLRIFTPVTASVVDIMFNGFVDTARKISQYDGIRPEMNIDRHCEYCDFEPLCRARMTGSDLDFIKEREYYIDEDKRKDSDSEEDELDHESVE